VEITSIRNVWETAPCASLTMSFYHIFHAVHKPDCFELTASTEGQLPLCGGKDFEAFRASSLCLALHFLLLISSLVRLWM